MMASRGDIQLILVFTKFTIVRDEGRETHVEKSAGLEPVLFIDHQVLPQVE
jgi:hypothetical protein